MNLLQKTRALARVYDGNITELCKAIGVTPRWFYHFINEEERDYGVKKVQALWDAMNRDKAA